MLKTLNIELKDKNNIKVLKEMCRISKNIYNITIFYINLYTKYKKLIYKNLNLMCETTDWINDKNIREEIFKNIDYYYILETKNKNFKIKMINIYEKLKEEIIDKKIIIDNNNFDNIKLYILKLFETEIKENKTYEHLILEKLKSYYFYNFYFVKKNIINGTRKYVQGKYSEEFINDVMSDNKIINYEIKEKKNNIFYNILTSDQNIITRYVYRQLKENTGKLQSDMVLNIINKVFENFSSYYKLREKGYYANKPYYLKKDGYFTLKFHNRIFEIEDEYIKLNIGEYMSNNYTKITGRYNFIKIAKNQHCNKIYIKDINEQKINKKENYIIDNKYYIDKKNKNIIQTNFIKVKIDDKLKNENIIQAEVVPMDENGYYFKLCITYDTINNKKERNREKLSDEEKKKNKEERNKLKKDRKKKNVINEEELKHENSISIDLGTKNLMTIYNPKGEQHIIKGGTIISINSYYNKKIDTLNKTGKIKTKVKKEYKFVDVENKKKLINRLYDKKIYKIDNYFNEIVKYMEKEYQDKNIIVGYNKNWKQNINIGKNNNRKMYEIPYAKLISKMRNKFQEKLIITEESYTSKCDALNLEEIGRHDKYSGKRIKRGLFISGNNKKMINADINGAINIMRKKINITNIDDSKIMNPKVIKIFQNKKNLSMNQVIGRDTS